LLAQLGRVGTIAAVFTRSAALYDALYSWKDYAAEAIRLRELIATRSAGTRLLDVACGTGKHLEQLRQWYDVEGLDLDPRLLELARARLPGVPLHQAEMTQFELGRQFDAVLCLFSSIGYVKTPARLRRAVASMARHVAPGGVLVVEPWFAPETFHPGRPHALFVDQPELKICRMNVSAVRGAVSVLDFHYLVATPDGVERLSEHHQLGLFTRDQYLDAFRAAELEVEHDPTGLTDRGLYVGVREPTGR
jgi:SAM-dependent methyltransferase